jgi:hypothetical protein
MDSQTSVSKFLFFATLLSLCFVCYGFNVNRFEESSNEGPKSVNSIFGGKWYLFFYLLSKEIICKRNGYSVQTPPPPKKNQTKKQKTKKTKKGKKKEKFKQRQPK